MALGAVRSGDFAFDHRDRALDAGAAAHPPGTTSVLPQTVVEDAQRIGRLDRLGGYVHAVRHVGIDRLDAVERRSCTAAASYEVAEPEAPAGLRLHSSE